MLSGFGIYLSSKRPKCSIKGAIKFAIDKVKKIYPAYIFSLLLGCIWLFLATDNMTRFIAKVVAYGLIDASLLQSLTGMTKFSHSLNGVCWFLSTIFICYMFCPLFLKIVDRLNTNKKTYYFMILSFAMLMLLSILAYYIDKLELINGMINDLFYGHPFIRCWYLLIGMIVGSIYKRNQKQINGCHVFATMMIAILWFLFRNEFEKFVPFIRLMDVMICTIVLYVISMGSGRIIDFLKLPKMVWLGSISMYIFLFHYPVRMIVATLFGMNDVFGMNVEISGLIQMVIIIALTSIIIKAWTECRMSAKNE